MPTVSIGHPDPNAHQRLEEMDSSPVQSTTLSTAQTTACHETTGRGRKVLLVTPWYHPDLGGIVTITDKLAKYLSRQGHDVTILVGSEWHTGGTDTGANGEHVVRLPLPAFRSCTDDFRLWARYRLLFLPNLFNLCRLIRQRHIDIVHVLFVPPFMPYFLLGTRLCKTPLVVWLQGSEVLTLDQQPSSFKRVFRRSMNEAAFIGGCCADLLERAKAGGLSTSTASGVLTNGVDPDDFRGLPPHLPTKPPFVLAAGLLVPRKGFDILIRAFRDVSDHHPDVRLRIAGEGSERARLEQLIGDLHLKDRVKLVGGLRRDELMPLYASCTLFALSSRHEGLPQVVLEAMMAEAPVVSTDVNGVREIITDGDTGLLVSAKDPASLAKGILRLLDDPGLASCLSSNGRKRVEHLFTWGPIARQWGMTYERVLGEAASRSSL